MDYCKISLKKLSGDETKPGYHNGEFKKLFGGTKVGHCLTFSRAEFFQAGPTHSQGMSISGVQQKLSLKEGDDHELAVTIKEGTYILKPSPESYPYAAENEHTAMRVSALVGIETAQCALISFREGELAYITKRFDRLEGGQKQHQEDLLQCMGLPSDRKYESTYEAAGQCITKVTHGKQVVVLDFVRRVILAYIMGNDDLHLKNISAQRAPDNRSRFYDKLTPNYDVLFCSAFKPDEDQNKGLKYLALGLLKEVESDKEYFSDNYNDYGFYTGYDFIELGRRLGLAEKPVRKFIERLKKDESKILDLISHSYMPEEMSRRAGEMVKDRIKILQIMESTRSNR
ncbi:MAG: HipA domain-containing protein [Motiliproteus sp.]